MPITEKPHISNTQLEMFWRCPEQYRRRYMEHEKLPPGIALIQGKAVHKGAEHNFRQKIESYTDVSKDEIVDVTIDAYETEIAGGYQLNQDEMDRGSSVVLGETKDQTARLAELHADTQAPEYQPIATEQKSIISLQYASHDLMAITDLVDDKQRITDIKTAGRSMPESSVHESTQLTIYAAAHITEYGLLPTEVRFDVLVKTKKPKRQVLISERNEIDLQVLSNRINTTLETINAGNFPPCPSGSWQCSPKWCGYWMTCPYVNNERSFNNGK